MKKRNPVWGSAELDLDWQAGKAHDLGGDQGFFPPPSTGHAANHGDAKAEGGKSKRKKLAWQPKASLARQELGTFWGNCLPRTAIFWLTLQPLLPCVVVCSSIRARKGKGEEERKVCSEFWSLHTHKTPLFPFPSLPLPRSPVPSRASTTSTRAVSRRAGRSQRPSRPAGPRQMLCTQPWLRPPSRMPASVWQGSRPASWPGRWP